MRIDIQFIARCLIFSLYFFFLPLSLSSDLFAVYAQESDHTPPSTPYALRIVYQQKNFIKVSWVGSGDDDRSGQAKGYQLRFSPSAIETEADWQAATVLSFRPLSQPLEKEVTVLIEEIQLGDKGYLSVRAFDEADNWSDFSEAIEFEVIDPFLDYGDKLTRHHSQALELGYEPNGQRLYGCVAYLEEGVMLPGKIGLHLRGCHVARKGREVSSDDYRYIKKLQHPIWRPYYRNIPPNAIILGQLGKAPLHLCRAYHQQGLHSGHVAKGETACTISYGGLQKNKPHFEILLP